MSAHDDMLTAVFCAEAVSETVPTSVYVPLMVDDVLTDTPNVSEASQPMSAVVQLTPVIAFVFDPVSATKVVLDTNTCCIATG